MLIKPYIPEKRTKGGILLSDKTAETMEMTTVVGLVVKMGDLCYKDKEGTFLCPEIEKEKKEPIYLEPIRNQYEHCEPWLPHMPETYMECILIA